MHWGQQRCLRRCLPWKGKLRQDPAIHSHEAEVPSHLQDPKVTRDGQKRADPAPPGCCALLCRASVYLENGLRLARPCSAPHRGAFALFVRVTLSIRAGLMGTLRHRGVVEKTRSSSPGERLCPEDTGLRAALNPPEQGWDRWVGTERWDLD